MVAKKAKSSAVLGIRILVGLELEKRLIVKR